MEANPKKFFKIAVALLGVALVGLFSALWMVDARLPDAFYVAQGEDLSFELPVNVSSSPLDISAPTGSNAVGTAIRPVKLSLFGIFPIKSVSVATVESAEVVPLGSPFGIKIYTDGVIVTDTQPVDSPTGNIDPGKDAGIKTGDNIVEINGVLPKDSNHAARLFNSTDGAPLKIKVKRDGKTHTISLTPAFSVSENCYKAGLWIKDSSAGIGTLTFYSPGLNVVAGLGHGICETDPDSPLPISGGEMVGAEIFALKKGRNGSPGELKGRFSGGIIGDIYANNETGIYATRTGNITAKEPVPIAYKQDIRQGKAKIITTIDSDGPKEYECYIEKISLKAGEQTKNMLIRITDKTLLSQTGGILQGMSGSPIIQNGKLVGALTHVFVDDPTKGYAIFAENMLETTQSVAEQQLKEAS